MDHTIAAPEARIINVCSGRSTSVLEVAGLIDGIAGSEPALRHAPARAGEIRHSRGSTALMCHLLGPRAFLSLEDGVASMMAAQARKRTA